MKFTPIFLSIASAVVNAREFVDDLGVTHQTDKDKPTIVTFAHKAVTLARYGLDKNQLLGTYGEWVNSGSDYDFENPEEGSSFPADPNPEEMRLLTKVVNLSPSCKAEYCTEFLSEKFADLKPDFFLVHGYRHSPWALSAEHLKNATDAGIEVIYTELSLEGEDCTSAGEYKSFYGKSMIDVIEQNHELAEFLNLDIPSQLDKDMERLCKSATTFQKNMKIARKNGVRAMGAYLSTSTSYIAAPHHDMVLRMVEELGAPIMHVGACTNKTVCPFDYFWEWLPIDEYFTGCAAGDVSESCNDETLYPVDMWLYDHRTTQTVTNEDFAIGFPDKAIVKQQVEYWPIGGRLITPHHAADILDILGPSLAGAERLHPKTECTSVDVTSTKHRTDGLPGGAYACYDDAEYHNSKYFSGCTSSSTITALTVPTVLIAIATTIFNIGVH